LHSGYFDRDRDPDARAFLASQQRQTGILNMIEPFLKRCPFCGGPAGFEEVTPENYPLTTWAVNCENEDEDCIACVMAKTYSRKTDAADAWNKRVIILDQKPVEEGHNE
jgi:hypothetical protein